MNLRLKLFINIKIIYFPSTYSTVNFTNDSIPIYYRPNL